MNPKFIAYTAVGGFVLSFIIGLIAGHSFGIVIAKAFVSAFGVALVFFLGSFIYNRFLHEVIEESSTYSEERSSVSLEEQIDEPLEEKETGEVFQYDMLSGNQDTKNSVPFSQESQMFEEKKVNQQTASSMAGFSPMPLETVVTEQKIEQGNTDVSVLGEDLENLEELPDISSNPIVLTEDIQSEPIIEDSGDGALAFRPAPVETIAQNGDVNLLASAIRTILAKDD